MQSFIWLLKFACELRLEKRIQMKNFYFFLFLIIGLSLNFSCEKKNSSQESGTLPAEQLAAQLTPAQMVEKGRSIYIANCLACHNADPSLDGFVGPANKGASLELLQAKLLNGTYPEGYAKKRESGQMPKFPQLKDQIPLLHAYLNAP